MKKLLFILLLTLSFTPKLQAQGIIGGGLAIWDDMALEIKGDIGLSEQFSLSPSIDYFFTEGVTVVMFNGDFHYNLGDVDALNFYPLAGINFMSVSSDFGSSSTMGFQAGGGATYALSDSMKLYGEVKFLKNEAMLNNLGFNFGVYFSL